MPAETGSNEMIKRLMPWLAAGAIVVLACALYVPFLGNPMIFDDLPFFSGGAFAYSATTPFGLGLRLPAYFTLAFPQVLWGQFPPWNHAEIHRILSLVFHIACALALYRLLLDLLRAAARPHLGANPAREMQTNAHSLAFIGAGVFAIHPVAVYGVGYLMQRTILMATLFSLLSIIFFARGLARGRNIDVLLAALFYSLAVFSKEHSLLLPAAAVMVAPLVLTDRRFAIRHAGLYLLACVPAAATVVALARGVIGTAYEPGADQLIEEIDGIPALNVRGSSWLVSAITQAGLFFRYLALWLVPDSGVMSIDMRVDFTHTWSPAWIALKLAAFAAFGALSLYLVSRRGRKGLIGFGMLYAWILFAVELGTVRFQEPFVLYRSYLWGPGILIALIGILSGLSRRLVLVGFLAACPVLFYQSRDRLQSFSSNLALWTDAAGKLPATPVPLGWRPLFNQAREQAQAGRMKEALETTDRCMKRYERSLCRFARGAIHNHYGEHEQALPYLEHAARVFPKFPAGHYQLGIALEKLGRVDEARQAYQRASDLGFIGGDYRLDMLDNPGTSGRRVLYDASRLKRRQQSE